MPWYQEAMKEAEDCHKLRGAVNQALIRRFPNGETHLGKTKIFLSEFIGQESERRELKHLSSARKRKRSDFLSSGERTGSSPNLYHVIACMRCDKGVARLKCSKSTVFELCWSV
jgi:hypothetical protein